MAEEHQAAGAALDELLAPLRARRPAVGAAVVPVAALDRTARHGWARALAAALGLLALAGLVTDAVAAGQLIDDAGPAALAVVWPLGGLGLVVAASLQVRFVDRVARLSMLRTLLLAYAAALALAGALFASPAPTSVAAALAWLLADQLNFLVPLLLWALAGDVFSAGQGLSTFPWISRMQYAGQIAGMAIAAVTPWLFAGPDIPLAWLLGVPVVLCVSVAVVLPRALRGATAAAGHGRRQSAGESWREALALVRALPAFRWLLRVSLAVLAAGVIIEFGFLDVTAERIAGDGDVQTFYAATALAGFVACWALQAIATPKVLRRWGIARALGVLPVVTVVAAVVMVVAGAVENLAAATAAVLVWRLPRWSLDASARQSALATLPDERRARASFLLDLLPLAASLLFVPIPIAVGRLTGELWPAAMLAAVLAVAGVVAATGVVRRWDDTQLSWQLKRRKRLG